MEGPIFSDSKSLCAVLFIRKLVGAEGLKEGHQKRLVTHLPEAERLNLIPGQLVPPRGGCLERWLSVGIGFAESPGLPQEAARSPGESLSEGRWLSSQLVFAENPHLPDEDLVLSPVGVGEKELCVTAVVLELL